MRLTYFKYLFWFIVFTITILVILLILNYLPVGAFLGLMFIFIIINSILIAYCFDKS